MLNSKCSIFKHFAWFTKLNTIKTRILRLTVLYFAPITPKKRIQGGRENKL